MKETNKFLNTTDKLIQKLILINKLLKQKNHEYIDKLLENQRKKDAEIALKCRFNEGFSTDHSTHSWNGACSTIYSQILKND